MKCKLLVAEDELIERKVLCKTLQKYLGDLIVLYEARNGREALELFASSAIGQFQIVLMDVMMPVMDGLEAVRRIRALDRADAKTVPIFAMTANAFAEDVARSKAAGMNEHLLKPLDEQKILQAIGRYVGTDRETGKMERSNG